MFKFKILKFQLVAKMQDVLHCIQAGKRTSEDEVKKKKMDEPALQEVISETKLVKHGEKSNRLRNPHLTLVFELRNSSSRIESNRMTQ
jgi:hypothetical protein